MALSTFEIMWNEKEMAVVENEKRAPQPRPQPSTPYSLPQPNWRPSLYNLPRTSGSANGERRPLLPRYEHIGSEQQLLSPDERTEATRLDVLYDIFFVSVISLSTYVNSLDDGKVKHFLAFFALLWTTWYQVSIHRSAFSPTDIFASVLQICQLGVFCLFAAYGLYFQHGLGFALALSRVVLVVQYSQSWLFVRNTRQRERQLGFVVAAKAVALLAFVVADMHGLRDLWYWIAAVETVVDTVVVFAQSDDDDEQARAEGLFSRISNLTLVVLGSGVLALGKCCLDLGVEGLVKLDIWVAGNVLCFFTIIYIIYALQASSTEQLAAGGKRGALWALLNFPFHFALFLSMASLAPAVLRVEGSSTQPSVAVFSLGAVAVLAGLLHLSSKHLPQINSREVASAVLLLVVGISIMHSSDSMTVSEGSQELLAVWALPVVVLKLGFVLVVDKVWGRANSQMAEEGKECVAPSLAWWSHTSFMGSW